MPPSVWDVQPYRFLTELKDRYTNAITVATRNHAEQMAPEAEQWMKDNAPWRDRTGDARAALRAYVVADKAEIASERLGKAAAAASDAELLKRLQGQARDRRSRAESNLYELENPRREEQFFEYLEERKAAGKTYPESKRSYLEGRLQAAKDFDRLAPKRASRLRSALKRQKQYKTPRSVPVGQSAVKAFEAGKPGRLSPIVSVKFTYQRDAISYDIWLEIANGGRYGIISRTIDHWGMKFMNRIRSIAQLKQFQGTMALSTTAETPQQQFAKHVAEKSAEYGRPYKPWSRAEQVKRKRRRATYNPKQEKQRRQENKAFTDVRYERSSQADVTRGVGRSDNPIPETRTLNLRKLGR